MKWIKTGHDQYEARAVNAATSSRSRNEEWMVLTYACPNSEVQLRDPVSRPTLEEAKQVAQSREIELHIWTNVSRLIPRVAK